MAMASVENQPRKLQSFICGEWRTGVGEGALTRDAGTGAPVALVDSEGLDFVAALDWGRTRGGKALRAMNFHQRANMLKAVAQVLTDAKEQFYQLSFATGATRADGAIDIEGGIGTLLAYASRGRRELPADTFLVEGDVESLARDGSFAAQHVLTPLRGVAVHIDAFNFPCWGMLEKIAPCLLAGVPAIVKPASQTAYLTELMFRRIIESAIFPEGALQLICGGVGDLMEHLTGQDVVTFTGSAATGARLRTHPVLVRNSVRFNMEADSVNASVLGPDAAPGTDEFDLFIKEVAREMTAKAGQKCTAIRRALVPRAFAEAVIDSLRRRLSSVAVGDPREEATRMGALASLAQREEVRARIAELAREAEIVVGDPTKVSLTSGDADKGAFLNPVLLYCAKPAAAKAAHSVEAFGPVATLMPYDDLDEAIDLANRGGGSLVASVFTNDERVARELVLGLGAQHGRILVGNRASAKSSTGHGSPLPGLVHGGPGRAGGGEELGGVRAVKHYMQRTAVQGAPRLLSAVTGRWTEGAPVDTSPPHPFRKSLAELKVGDQIVTAKRVVALEDIEHFAHFTGDTFYAHMDEEAARANPLFGGRVAHGYLVVAFAAGLFVDPAPGPVLANYGLDNLRFLTPVKPGDELQVALTCKEINQRGAAEHGEVRWDCKVTNQTGAVVARYELLTMVAKTWG
jgi:oxepin-CoA hydrolase/3-oxo-5,6-dehydrosuberyl-CoA semialdehyde dehydrogenase